MHRHPRNSLRAAIPLTNANAPEAPAGDASGSGNGQTPPEQPSGNGGDAPSGMPGGSGEVTQGTSANTIDTDTTASGTTYTSTGDDENALLATNGATVNLENAAVTSSAQNGNGVFSYGSGTTVNISDSTITTTADNSGGIQTTGGATTNASNLTVDTSGNSAAAIRSDRGGGTVLSN